MGTRIWIGRLLIAGALALPGVAQAGPAEDEFLGLFRASCLAHLTTPKSIAARFSTTGIKPLPPESAQTILGSESGAVWPVYGSSGPFAVALTDRSVCMVVGVSPRLDDLVAVFEDTTRQKQRSSKRTSHSAQLSYAVTVPGTNGAADTHALVEINALTTDGETVLRISSIPEPVIFGAGGSISWP